MKPKVGWLVGLLVMVGIGLGGCADSQARERIAALTTRVERAEANLARLNSLHHWVTDSLWPKYVLLHKKVWGVGQSDPPPPVTPPPPFE